MYAECSKCKSIKEKLIYRKYGHCYKYTDVEGRRWSGTICPDCYAASRRKPPKVVPHSNAPDSSS